jgi:hypothetical protein
MSRLNKHAARLQQLRVCCCRRRRRHCRRVLVKYLCTRGLFNTIVCAPLVRSAFFARRIYIYLNLNYAFTQTASRLCQPERKRMGNSPVKSTKPSPYDYFVHSLLRCWLLRAAKIASYFSLNFLSCLLFSELRFEAHFMSVVDQSVVINFPCIEIINNCDAKILLFHLLILPA